MTKLSTLLICTLTLVFMIDANSQQVYKDQFAHTYSIVARDANSGEMAVAVQSHWFSVGTLVSWGKSGIGVVATQSFVNPAFGPQGLKLLTEGKNAQEALDILINQDDGRDYRQVAILDANGVVAAYTGEKCIISASHQKGDNFSVQANMMINDEVVPAIAESFQSNEHLPLAERVLAAMEAGQSKGGDIRGKQSAVLLVVGADLSDKTWLDKKVDLRVDDNDHPLKELKRLLQVHRAYEHMNLGDLAVEHGDMQTALKEYNAAEQLFPDNLEMKYWKAVALANNNRLNDALPIFKSVFKEDENWRELTKRLPISGLLNLSTMELDKILKL